MRLVIREYLSLLRESGELDVLLPDLLLSMGIVPLTRPGKGARQFGVDVPAVGIDPSDGTKKLFLLTIKRGDLTRADWNGTPQAIRPSLEEILDSYLPSRVRAEHQSLPKKIILATGGELRPEVEPSWRDFSTHAPSRYSHLGFVEFDLWDGDRLAAMIERHLLGEHLFPESARSALRRTIALVGHNEDEPRLFYDLVEQVLLSSDVSTARTTAGSRSRARAVRLLALCERVLFYWAQQAGNLKPALLGSERAVLTAWDWIRRNDLFDCPLAEAAIDRLSANHRAVGRAYAAKLGPYCEVRDGLFGWGGDEVEYPIRVLELAGIFGSQCFQLLFAATRTADLVEQEELVAEADKTAARLVSLYQHNPCASSPVWDGQAIDLGLALLALEVCGYQEEAREWAKELISRVVAAFRFRRHFPIATDSYEDLVALTVSPGRLSDDDWSRLAGLSTLLPAIAEWFIRFDQDEIFAQLSEATRDDLSAINLQLWYPDDSSDPYLFNANAGEHSGTTVSSIQLPKLASEHKNWMARELPGALPLDSIDCIREGRTEILLMASRHFRTPLVPAFWRDGITSKPVSEGAGPEN